MQQKMLPHTMIRIAIVDDHAMVRAGLRQFFSDQIDFAVVAEAANGRFGPKRC
jgi:two-component system invasion response regulator UvrY